MFKAKKILMLFLPVIVTGTTLISGCENDLKDIQKISAAEINKPVERYTGVDVIYSDSARVKARMITPLMIKYLVAKPYTDMPKGVKVTFFDNNLDTSSTIKADHGIYYESEKRIALYNNVVAVNIGGDVFTSEELIWDETTKKIHSDKLVHVKFANGNLTDGTSFVSDESFNHYTMTQATALIHVNNQDVSH